MKNTQKEELKYEDEIFDFEKTYLIYFSKLKYFAKEYVISDEDAENIAQDVFMELWEKRLVFMNYTNLIAFLFTAVKNRSLNYLRHRMIEQKTTDRMQEEYAITIQMHLNSLEAFDQTIFSEQDIEQIVSRAIDSLPDCCRQVFIMNKLEGKKQQQIAAELNISINTVESQMGIAYKKLKAELKDYVPVFLFLFIL
jgi:RNA polymerase sigma-70 factor (ECF subfamily)